MPCNLFIYEEMAKMIILKWKVKAGMAVNQVPFVLFTYQQCINNNGNHGENVENGTARCPEEKFKINKSGIIIKRLLKKNGDQVEHNDALFEYELCSHPTLMKDLCAVCGVNIQKFDSSEQKKIVENTSVAMVHSIPELRVSKQVAEDLGRADEDRLLKYRKLVLLVDLDQTIVHSTNQHVPKNLSDQIFHYQLYGPKSPWYITKFRPYMNEFLEEISKYYELHICTFGARRYAHHIANLIDPHSKFFPKDRILSRDEFFDSRSKTGNMKSLFPCGDSMVCIIDDRIDVWNYAPNVVQVKPYVCFNTDDINAPEKLPIGFDNNDDKQVFGKQDDDGAKKEPDDAPTTTTTKDVDPDNSNKSNHDDNDDHEPPEKESTTKLEDKDQEQETKKDDKANDEKNDNEEFQNVLDDQDDYLLYLKDILIKIHKKYYEEFDEKNKYRCEGEQILIPDLKKIIPAVRRTVLHGVNIVFSGVIATNMSANLNRYYRLAESMGAIVTNDIIVNGSPKTTHLIAAKWGTAKVNKCVSKYKQIKIVTPDWLMACADRWQKVDEDLFRLTKDTVYNINEKDDYKKVHYDFSASRIDQPSTSKEGSEVDMTTMLDLSPLSSFSMSDLNDMGKEVADACSESSDSDNDGDDDDDDEASRTRKPQSRTRLNPDLENEDDDDDEEEENYAFEGDYPKGWKNQTKRGLKRTNDVFNEDDDDDDDDDGGGGEEEDDDDDEEEDEDDEDKVNNDIDEEDEDEGLSEDSSSDAESIGSVDEEMAAALEKEFFDS